MKTVQDKIFLVIRFAAALGCIYLIFREGISALLSEKYAVLLFTVSIIGIFALVCVISMLRVLRIVFAAGLLLLAVFYFSGDALPKLLGAAALLLALNELAGERRKEKGAVLILLAALTLICPTSKKPFDWSFVVRIAEAIRTQAEALIDELSYRFDLGMSGKAEQTGYSSFFAEAGDLNANDRVELAVKGTGNGSPMYLSGRTYRSFDGVHWTNDGVTQGDDRTWFPRFINLLYRNGVQREKVQAFSRLHKTDITYELLRTSDVIHPETTLKMKGDTAAAADTYTFSETMEKGTAYSVLWLEIDYGSAYFDEYIRTAPDYPLLADYRTLLAYTEDVYGSEAAECFTRELYEEAAGETPPETGHITHTQQTEAYAKKLTRDLKSDYDKIRLIEKNLREYTYALKAGPETKDLVETFLFRTKEGYCVHFASAAAELMDLAGIPSRVCTGYAANTSKEKTEGRLPVNGSEAHAWAEGYLEGYGWVPVEPTPIKPTAAMTSWSVVLPEDEGIKAEESQKPYVDLSKTPDEESTEMTEETFDPAERNARRILLLLLLLIPGLFLLRRLLLELYLLLLPEKKRIRYEAHALRRFLELSCHTRNEPLLFFEEKLPDEEKEEFRETVLSYYRYSYGNEMAEEGLCRRIRDLKRKLLKKTSLTMRIRFSFLTGG